MKTANSLRHGHEGNDSIAGEPAETPDGRQRRRLAEDENLARMFEEQSALLDELLAVDGSWERREELRLYQQPGRLVGWLRRVFRPRQLSQTAVVLLSAAAGAALVVMGYEIDHAERAERVKDRAAALSAQALSAQTARQVRREPRTVETVRPQSFELGSASVDGGLRVPVLNVAAGAPVFELDATLSGDDRNTAAWRVELMSDDVPTMLAESASPVQKGDEVVLAVNVPIGGLADGLYSVRLTPIRGDGSALSAETRPFILKRVTAVTGGQVF